MRPLAGAAAVVATATILGGCSSTPRYTQPVVTTPPMNQPSTPASSSAAATPSAPVETTPAPTPTIGVTKTDWEDVPGVPHPGTVVTVEPKATGDDTRTNAQERAVAGLTIFLRRDLSPSERKAQLRPYLGELAMKDYAPVDPAKVPGTVVTGPGTVIPTTSDRIARVQIPTDAGEYVVNLSRTTEDPTWRIERFVLPEREEGHDF